MSDRIGTAALLALVGSLLVTSNALAKGNFDFLIVAGDGMPGELRIADPAITTNWFVFADMPEGGIPAPANPPTGGYVITRYYLDHGRAISFDRLHYYPEAGLVYYDGIQGGWSDYDAKWYPAQPAARAIFEREVRALARQEAPRHRSYLRRT